jgi:hypothetical protein
MRAIRCISTVLGEEYEHKQITQQQNTGGRIKRCAVTCILLVEEL